MIRQSLARALFCSAAALAGCGSETPPTNQPAPNQAGAAGTSTSASGSGGVASGGTGQPQAGTGGQVGTTGGGGASNGGAGGAGGAGGEPAVSTLPKRALLYHFSTLEIASVPAQLESLTGALEGWGYEVEVSEAPTAITAQNLTRFGVVAMVNTCFQPFGEASNGDAETVALSGFVDNGGGLFGTHCATVTFQAAEPPANYNKLIGGRGGHGFFEGASACRTLEAHPTTAELPATFAYTGNLDNADFLSPDTKVLVKCKWSGGDQIDTAVSWYRNQGKGRVFYTNFAKEDNDLKDPVLGAKHILVGLGWLVGR